MEAGRMRLAAPGTDVFVRSGFSTGTRRFVWPEEEEYQVRQLETETTAPLDIHLTAQVCHIHTSDADRVVYVRLTAPSVAGNGNYTAYVTVQHLGAGVAHRQIPIQTAAAASGVTDILFLFGAMPLKNTDVLTVYLLGLTGDTAVVVTTEIWGSN
jgi:hypothetical protein